MTFYSFVRSVSYALSRLFFKIKIEGKENIPEDGNLIICANHTNVLDPVMLSFTSKRHIQFMAKKELFDNRFLSWFLSKLKAFPVDRDSTDIKAVKTSLKILKNKGVLGIFPEGTRVTGFNLENAKPGVAMMAIKSKTPIVPIYIDSSYKIFSSVNIYIGSPIEVEKYKKDKLTKEDYQTMSEDILKEIYRLKVDKE